MARPSLHQRSHDTILGGARPLLTVLVDASMAMFGVLTIVGVHRVLSFHMVFAMLTVVMVIHTGRSILARAIIGVGVSAIGVSIGVAENTTSADELYEFPILILMLATVYQALKLWRDAVDRVEAQQDRLRIVHNASQIELKDQLLLSQRLDTMGRLSAGVVHNVNNVMTGILSLAERIEHTATADEPRSLAARIGVQSRNGAGVLGDLLRFARPGDESVEADVAYVVSRETSMLAMLAGPQVSIVVGELEDDLVVSTTAGRLAQVLVNLVINARDALPSGGTVKIDLSAEGSEAVLVIADDGVGMDEETRSRAFDPFFTTKTGRDGSGLGLYTLVQIVEDAGGSVLLQSRPGEGTSVEIRLPLVSHEKSNRVMKPVDVGPERFFGTETVLLVEDDALLREQLTWSLELYGYEVVGADDGDTAIGLLSDGLRVDVVVTDVVMRRVDGRELYRRLKSMSIDAPVLFMSAFDRSNLPGLDGDVTLLIKPFGRNQLLAELRAVLDDRQRTRT